MAKRISDTIRPIINEALSEINEDLDKNIIEEYEKLGKKCDTIINKIKKRKLNPSEAV